MHRLESSAPRPVSLLTLPLSQSAGLQACRLIWGEQASSPSSSFCLPPGKCLRSACGIPRSCSFCLPPARLSRLRLTSPTLGSLPFAGGSASYYLLILIATGSVRLLVSLYPNDGFRPILLRLPLLCITTMYLICRPLQCTPERVPVSVFLTTSEG